jgi:hypothetical protein
MPDNAQGATSQVAQTAAGGEQTGTQQTQANTQATQQASTQQASQATGQQTTNQQTQQPSVEELQRQIQERDEKLRLTEGSARHWQSQADRFRQVALGSQPQVDPVATKAKQYAQQFNLNEEDTRNILGILQAEIQPLAQRNQQLEAAMAGTSQVNSVLQTVSSDAQFGRFMQDPEVFHGVQQMLQQVALDGQPKLVSVEYAKDLARMLAFDKFLLNGNGATQQPVQQPQQFQPVNFGNGIMGQPGGYRPAMAAVKPTDPGVEFFNQEIQAAYPGLRKTT